MMRKGLRYAFVFAYCARLSVAAHAAPTTEVLTALDTDTAIPQLRLSAGFELIRRNANIARESIDSAQGNAQDVRELRFFETTQQLVVGAEVGLFRDLEFRAFLPVILQNRSRLRFAEGVDFDNSSIWNGYESPASPQLALTEIPAERQRNGLGDIRLGLGWSPLVERKLRGYPTLTLRADVLLPTGPVRDPVEQSALPGGSSGNVGLGQTSLDFSLSVSKQLRRIDPYILIGTQLPFANPKQTERGLLPPIRARAKVGAAFNVYRDKNQFYGIDFALGAQYVSRGRTYSALSDYLPNFDQTRANNNSGATPGTILPGDYARAENYATQIDGARCGHVDGVPCGELTYVDEHLETDAMLTVHLAPSRYFWLRLGGGLGFVTSHLLTDEPAGQDLDPDSAAGTLCGGVDCVGRINAVNSAGEDERSPYFDPRYDTPGQRFLISGLLDLKFAITAALMF